MSSESRKSIPDDEIDLKPLGTMLLRGIIYPVKLLATNLKITSIFVLASVLLGLGVRLLIPKTYSATFIIRPTEQNERMHLRLLDDLHRLYKLGDYKGLASELKISIKMARGVIDFGSVNFAFAKNKADSSNTTEVHLKVNDYNYLLPLQKAFLIYMEENQYFKKVRKLKEKSLNSRLDLVEKEIVLLDSLKKLQLTGYDNVSVSNGSGLFLKDFINPTAIYTLSLERVTQRSGLISQKALLDSFLLIKGVVPSEKHSWPPRLLNILIILVPAFLVLCVIYLAIRTQLQNKT